MTRRVRKTRASYKEQAIQIAVVQFLRVALPPDAVLFAVRNEAKRSPAEHAIAVQVGVLDGMVDLCFSWHGLYCIEMKKAAPKDKPTMHEMTQGVVQQRLRESGAKVAVCWTVEMVERALRDWGVPLRASVLASGAVQRESA